MSIIVRVGRVTLRDFGRLGRNLKILLNRQRIVGDIIPINIGGKAKG